MLWFAVNVKRETRWYDPYFHLYWEKLYLLLRPNYLVMFWSSFNQWFQKLNAQIGFQSIILPCTKQCFRQFALCFDLFRAFSRPNELEMLLTLFTAFSISSWKATLRTQFFLRTLPMLRWVIKACFRQSWSAITVTLLDWHKLYIEVSVKAINWERRNFQLIFAATCVVINSF